MINLDKFLINNKLFNLVLVIFIMIVTYIQSFNDLSTTQFLITVILWAVLIINDIFRNLIKKNKVSYFSLLLSLIIAAALKYITNGLAIYYFYFFYIIEILQFKNRIKNHFLIIHFLLYVTIINFNLVKLPFQLANLSLILENLLIYFSLIYIVYITYSVHTEKEKTEILNKKLRKSNIKLHEYSQKIEELSVAKERERISQELHDSLGHSFMALMMHLEFAEKNLLKNPEKAREVVSKARDITKSGISDLRKAVDKLKKERKIDSLKNSIEELVDNFSSLDDIKISFQLDEEVEKSTPELKLCIYKTIRESITNSIKHGKAAKIKFQLFTQKNKVFLITKDDGMGCININKSNGLKNMENRVKNLNGTINFNTEKNKGFETIVELPKYHMEPL